MFGFNHVLRHTVVVLAALAMLATAMPSVAAAQADPKDACKKGGYLELTRQDGSAFRNQGACVSYVATGYTPLSVVVQQPLSVVWTMNEAGDGFGLVVTGAGLLPFSSVTMVYSVIGNPGTLIDSSIGTVGVDGTFFLSFGLATCGVLATIYVVGITASGNTTEAGRGTHPC